MKLRRLPLYLWAAPCSLLGLAFGLPSLLLGGGCQVRCGVLEFWGGSATWLLNRGLVKAAAITLGHVILGQDPNTLDRCRPHELVHVRQVELWGPLFLPAYLLASLWAHWKGGHYYHDNLFEIDAVRRSGVW